jgi:8-oxo-dGTP diphosphatase
MSGPERPDHDQELSRVEEGLTEAALDGAPAAGSPPPPEKSPRLYPSRPIVGVGAVIIEDGRVVLIKRRYEPLAGQWSLPGGTLDVGETLEAGVAREMLEETGLEVEVGPVIDVFDRILLDADRKVRYHFVLVDYLCRPRGGTLAAASDVTDAVYAHPDNLAEFKLTPKAEEMIRKGFDLWRRIGGS